MVGRGASQHPCPSDRIREGKLTGLSSVGEQVDDRQQNNGTQQCHQHGWNGDRIVDRPDVKDGAEEVTCQECAYDGHNDVDQQVRAVMHDLISVTTQPITAATIRCI